MRFAWKCLTTPVAGLFIAIGLAHSNAARAADHDFADYNLITDAAVKPFPDVAKPGYLQSYVDPVFGTTVARITGDPGTAIPNVGGTWPKIARHHYSKDAAWNADQTLIVLTKGLDSMYFLDGESYEVLFRRAGPGGEARWHPSLPNVMIYVAGNGEIGHWDVRTNSKKVLYKARGYSRCQFGPFEGNASKSGSRLAVAAKRTDGREVAFAVRLGPGGARKYADIDLASNGVTSLDWASISASGKYVVVNGTIGGHDDATQVFKLSGRKVGSAWSACGVPSHYDLTYDASGLEVAVGVAKSGPHDGRVIMRGLLTGAITVLNSGGYADHTSARNSQRPGWAYVTTNYAGPNYPPFRNEVFAVKLDGSRAVQRFANVRSTAAVYESESHAVPSPDGKRMIFASDWMDRTGPIQAYVVDIRPLKK